MKQMTMKKKELRVLYLEDSAKDIEIIRELLTETGYNLSMDCTDKKIEYISFLRSRSYDIILSDFKLPGFDAFGALASAKEVCPDVPFICVSGSIGEEIAIDLIKKGAIDYVLKDRMVRLPLAIQRALDEAKEKKSRQQAEAKLGEETARRRILFEQSPDGIVIIDPSTARFIEFNTTAYQQLGYSREEFAELTISDIEASETKEQTQATITRVMQEGRNDFETLQRTKNGEIRNVHVTAQYIDILGKPVYHCIWRDITGGRKAEKALQESEKRLRVILDATKIGIWDWDLKNKIWYASPMAYTMLGYDHENYVPDRNSWFERIHPEDRTRIENITKDVLDKKTENYEYTARVKHADGSYRWINVQGYVVERDESGNATRVSGIRMDVTESKRAEENLSLLNHTIKSTSECISITDLDNNILFVNHAFLNTYGFSEEELIGNSISIIRVEKPESRDEVLKKTLQGGWHGILINRRKDGTIFPVSLSTSVVLNDIEEPIALVGVAADITDRMKAQEALEEQTAYLRQLFENAPVATALLNTEFQIMDVNKVFANVFQFSKDEIIGEYIQKIIVPDSRLEESKKLLQQVEEKGHIDLQESIRKRKNGQAINVLISGYPIIVRESILGYFFMYVDITEQKRLQEQLMHSQKMESLGTLAGGIAHDFNNLLAIILGHAGSLMRNKSNPAEIEKSVDSITKSAQRGASLVKQLLTFARKTEVVFESVQVNDTIVEITKLLKETFPKTIKVFLSLQNNLPALVADATQIHQVLLNLCVNARDAMPYGGTLSLTTNVVPGLSLKGKYPKAIAQQYVQIVVADTGIGMDEETLQKIFEPFYTTKGVGKGTGLGLALVYGIINSHSGLIEVQSKVKEGTSFIIYLPIPERPLEIKQKETKSIDEIAGGSETVLVIEDEEMLRELISNLLISKGYNVLTAEDGEKGLEVYEKSKRNISIIITDLGLPILGGEEVLKKVLAEQPDANIILASGFIDPEVKYNLIAAGAKHFIQKPYAAEEVLDKIREILDIKK